MTFSLDRARLFRLLSDGRNLQILSSTDLGQDRHALVAAGEWLGTHQVRCYLVLRHAGEWQVMQIPNQWIVETARLLQPLLPVPGEGQPPSGEEIRCLEKEDRTSRGKSPTWRRGE